MEKYLLKISSSKSLSTDKKEEQANNQSTTTEIKRKNNQCGEKRKAQDLPDDDSGVSTRSSSSKILKLGYFLNYVINYVFSRGFSFRYFTEMFLARKKWAAIIVIYIYLRFKIFSPQWCRKFFY